MNTRIDEEVNYVEGYYKITITKKLAPRRIMEAYEVDQAIEDSAQDEAIADQESDLGELESNLDDEITPLDLTPLVIDELTVDYEGNDNASYDNSPGNSSDNYTGENLGNDADLVG